MKILKRFILIIIIGLFLFIAYVPGAIFAILYAAFKWAICEKSVDKTLTDYTSFVFDTAEKISFL